MDLSHLSTLSKVSIFQKMRYNSLFRARKTCRTVDEFVESHRHRIARNPTMDLDFEIILNSQKYEPNDETSVEFSIKVFKGRSHSQCLLTDPWRQLSAIAIYEMRLENSFTREQLSGNDLDEILASSVFPLLKKMKPICRSLIVSELPTQPLIQLSNLVRHQRLYYLSKLGHRSDLNVHEIVANSDANELSLKTLWQDTDVCSAEIVKDFIKFSYICLFHFSSSFLFNMIQVLCEMSDFGVIQKFYMLLPGTELHHHQLALLKGDLLFCKGSYSLSSYKMIRFFEGISKWIILGEDKDQRRHVAKKTVITFYFVEKDFSILFDKLMKIMKLPTTRADEIREEFINAPDMEGRREVFEDFYYKSTRKNRKRQHDFVDYMIPS